MDEYMDYNRHYITVDEQGCITGGWSDAIFPNRDTTDAICINEHGGYQFRLSPGGEENPALFAWDYMVPLYKWDGQNVAERSADEINADITEEQAKAAEEEAARKAQELTWDTLAAAIREGVNSV